MFTILDEIVKFLLSILNALYLLHNSRYSHNFSSISCQILATLYEICRYNFLQICSKTYISDTQMIICIHIFIKIKNFLATIYISYEV